MCDIVVMPFAMPDEFSKELSDVSVKIYRGYLNKLAREGYDTPQSLIDSAEQVAKYIGEVAGGSDDKSKHKRRIFVSAIFAVLPETYRTAPNPYQKLFEKSLQAEWTERRERKLPVRPL